jgi:hypothetical protein
MWFGFIGWVILALAVGFLIGIAGCMVLVKRHAESGIPLQFGGDFFEISEVTDISVELVEEQDS